MRLIDADALKENLGDTRDGKPVFRHTEFIRMDVLEEAIDKAPTIKAFTLADIEEQYRNGLEKGLEEQTICPILSDDEVKQPCVKSPCGFERLHGEWIEHRQFLAMGYFFSEYECSNCHDDVWQKTEWQFCPNCGADMRQKEGEAE